MDALARLPVFFALQGRRVVVAGGHAAAAWKIELLAAAGARVDVYAAAPSDDVRAAAQASGVTLNEREIEERDFADAVLAIGAFEDETAAATFAALARAAGVPVNVVDRPALSDFSFGTIVNRSPLVVGISTDGAAPVFAQAIRAKIEAMIPHGFARWAEAARRWRASVKSSGLSFGGRRRFWQLFAGQATAQPDRAPEVSDFDALLGEARHESVAVDQGSVMLVGAGPGDPELLTLRAVRALQSADVILFDALVSPAVLDFARREAKKMMVGKTGHGPACKQDDINRLVIALARQGKRVVRLKAVRDHRLDLRADRLREHRRGAVGRDADHEGRAVDDGAEGHRLEERGRPGGDHHRLHAGAHARRPRRDRDRQRPRSRDAGGRHRESDAAGRNRDRGADPRPAGAARRCAVGSGAGDDRAGVCGGRGGTASRRHSGSRAKRGCPESIIVRSTC